MSYLIGKTEFSPSDTLMSLVKNPPPRLTNPDEILKSLYSRYQVEQPISVPVVPVVQPPEPIVALETPEPKIESTCTTDVSEQKSLSEPKKIIIRIGNSVWNVLMIRSQT